MSGSYDAFVTRNLHSALSTLLSRPIQELVEQFQKLPGVGPKSAQRLTYHVLRRPEEEVDVLIKALRRVKQDLVVCSRCYNITEEDPCVICANPERNQASICVIEEPLDLISIEKTGKHTGVYHVLNGVINPLMGIGPEELRMYELFDRLRAFGEHVGDVELIIATNPSIEGEATAMYIKKEIQNVESKMQNVKITRIARGLPTGGDVEYADQVTLGRALEGRVVF